jgi:hypothetical protein
MRWAFLVALGHVADPTMGAYIATKGVATYAPPATRRKAKAEILGEFLFSWQLT